MHPAEKFFRRGNGPLAIWGTCCLCKHGTATPKERNPGRGWGMREGNKLRGRMIQHVKDAHPEVLKTTTAETTLRPLKPKDLK